ncbi:hypothetical protein RHMOL_Rhmol07G0249200 [Rhododendron molle]|uniref:Uncharacterized protein n=1 Tax=Rhododendron molle TaxID=49168 RepID=A0ACC0N5N2_RHOML|nr:hypothetical protein RHMOL_Rhmol07G0249200 [Rhododendron molle]
MKTKSPFCFCNGKLKLLCWSDRQHYLCSTLSFSTVNTAILAGILDVGFAVAAILVTHFAVRGDLRIDMIGFLCAGLNIIMYSSPLAAMVSWRNTKYSVD